MKKVLLITNHWPEPKTTGAGVHTMQLIKAFLKQNYHVCVASTAIKSEHSFPLKKIEVQEQQIELNNSSFDRFLIEYQPTLVVFDRFFTEEQFGWRVAQILPNAIRVLNTQDLHFVRKHREEAINEVNNTSIFNSSYTYREIASIYRCDLSLIISKVELNFLFNHFKIESKFLHYFPFVIEKPNLHSLPNFKEREHFVFVGNFQHKPNIDTVKQLYKMWPAISHNVPNAQMLCFGVYAGSDINSLNQPNKNFYIKGYADNLEEVLQKAKLMIAPIRFGSGLKTKFFDAIKQGTPFITSSIGAEGIAQPNLINKFVLNTESSFIEQAVRCYKNEDVWKEIQNQCINTMQPFFDTKPNVDLLFDKINEINNNLTSHRNQDFVTNMLLYHKHQSNKYLSKWIEQKNS